MWKELDLENSKINMSKVSPYTENLDTFERKQAFYHNGRLTPLKCTQNQAESDYVCYKREAGKRYDIDGKEYIHSGYMIDNELTDYIEINYRNPKTGVLTHLLDIADTYYKVEPYSITGNPENPDFEISIYLEGTYLGKASDYKNCTFYKPKGKMLDFCKWAMFYVVEQDNSEVVRVIWKYNIDTAFNIRELRIAKSDLLLTVENFGVWFISKAHVQRIKKLVDLNTSSYIDISSVPKEEIESSSYIWKGEDWLYSAVDDWTPYEYQAFTNINTYWYSQEKSSYYYIWFKLGFDLINISQDKTGGAENKKVSCDYYSVTVDASTGKDLVKKIFGKWWNYAYLRNSKNSNNPSFVDIDGKYFSYKLTFGGKYEDTQNLRTYQSSIVSPSAIWLEAINTSLKNYVNDSVFTNYQNFVVNYTNKNPVSIGHRYKMLMRLDTTNANYLKSDSNGVYVLQNGITYKISLSKMFPNSNYNTQVNLIDNNTYCGQVGGYLIFNTTSYFNTVFNNDPQKIICSCDDWNGRYISKTSSYQECNLKAVSRVGHFWNADSSQIPSVAISDELVENMDLFEFWNPTYEWSNPQYKIHPVIYDYIQHPQTVAYIYKQTDTTLQVNTMYENVKITSEGFSKNGIDPTRVFVHNNGIQIIPSLLFTTFYNSDVKNYIQIGVEVFELLKYSTYSLATPALVVDSENPISIDVSSETYRFVIQGSFYYVSGTSSSRKIINVNDLDNYACDVTGLDYLGYDSSQAYFFSSATGVIYTFNGANKLNSFIELDKRIPLKNDGKQIKICNIPSMNIVCLGFTDGCLILINNQAIFIEVQGLESLKANAENGVITINNKDYTFGTNTNKSSFITSDFILETSKIGVDRKTNITCKKHRVCFYCEKLIENPNKINTKYFTITITSRLGDKILTEKFEKKIEVSEFVDNEFQYEFTPKYTKANWFKVKIEMSTNLDLLNYYLDINDNAEENIIR